MDTKRAAEMLAFRGTSASNWNYVGTGVLRCGSCGGLLAGEAALGQVANRRQPDIYYCPNETTTCAQVRAPAYAVSRELQALAKEKWTNPKFLRRRRQEHLVTLDAEIAETRDVLEWCSDRRRRNQVARRIGLLGKWYVRTNLDKLSRRLPQAIAERAELAAVLAGQQSPTGTTYPSKLLKGLWSDWSTSLTSQTTRRRELLVLAVEDQQLVVDPGLKGAPYVRKVRRATA